MEEAEDKFGKKGTARAGLTLGIIGTALAALGNNNGCGCGGNGILGGLFGGNNNGCAMQAAEQAKTLAMAQGQMADNLSWANRVQSLQDDVDLYTYINGQTRVLSDQNYQGRITDIVEKYIKGIASNFFGFSTLPAQTVVTYVVRNWVDKHNGMIDLFVDKDGNINAPLIADALKSELKARGGFTIGRVKFSDSDVDELLTAFNQAKQKNR